MLEWAAFFLVLMFKLPLGSKRFLLLAAAAVVSASVLMPPVCNLVFKCGCSWLWTTAAAHCNIHNAAPPHCPWCNHGALGYYLPYAGFIAGQLLVGAFALRFTGHLVLAFLMTVVAVLPVVYLMGLVTLRFVHYPHLIFS